MTFTLAETIAIALGVWCFGYLTAAVMFMSRESDELLLSEKYMVDRLHKLEAELDRLPARDEHGRYVRRAA